MKELGEGSQPKLSSTILLVRGEVETEVLMVARSYQIDFASGAHVFPGGKVSEDDLRPEWRDFVEGDFEGGELAVRIGGIREVFEESGILLARSRSAKPGKHVSRDVCETLAPHRGPIDRREESFLELIKAQDLVLCVNELVPYAHWITPDMMPKRFDTRFFIARAPIEQRAVHDGRETTEAVWVQPSEILRREKSGEATLLFPTRVNLELLEDSGPPEAALDAARQREIVTVLPVVDKGEQGAVLKIPAEAGYRVTIEPLETVNKAMKNTVKGSA